MAKGVIHGLHGTGVYNTWRAVRRRCYDKKAPEYARYGARGITMCDRWKNSPANFFEDMGHRPFGHTLDRIDNTKGYSPDNCRWASAQQQANNRKTNRLIVYNGREYSVAQLAREKGMAYSTLLSRLKVMGIEDAIKKPVGRRRKKCP